MKPTKELLKAFSHVKNFHPNVSIVVFNKEGQWNYMDANFEGLNFSHDGINVSVLEDAVDSIKEFPFIYQANTPLELVEEVDEYKEYLALYNFMYDEPLKSWITKESYINLFENWDVLMDVVEKIEGMGYWVNRVDGDVHIVNNENVVVVNNQIHEGGIRATYKACVQFARNVASLQKIETYGLK